MKKNFSLILALAAAVLLGTATSSKAGSIVITVDPDGAGGVAPVTGVASIDEAPGNALAVGVIPFAGSPPVVGSTFTLLYQSKISTLNNTLNQPVFAFLASTPFQLTVVAAVTETVLSSNGTSITFGHAATGTNVINVYASPTNSANDLAGTGFATGTLVLSATVTDSSGNFSLSSLLTQALDQFGTNNYPGITTVVGTGATDLTASVTFVDPNYFPDLTPSTALNLTLADTNTSNNTPFKEVDPSALFSSDAVANGDLAHNIGTVNGVTGPNFQFQADANSSFTSQAIGVPEPASLALLAIGGLGLGLARTIRRRKA